MKSKLFEDFSAGVDRRRDRSMTQPDRLWNLKNAYIDNGGRLQVRPGVYKLPGAGLTNCEGLWYYGGTLYTFTTTGAAGSATFATVITLPNGPAGQTIIKRVWFASAVAASYYVVVEFSDGVVSHYYSATRITDANCPNTRIVTIAGNRVWCAATNGNVAFCQLDDPTDWTTTATGADAGFIAAASQAPGMGSVVRALNTYQSDIVFFFDNGAQVWYPDVDKTKMFIRQRIYNVGINRYSGPLAAAPFGADLAFLGQDGIRSLSLSQNTNNRIEQDIGAPIRDLPIGCQSYSVSTPFFYTQLYPQGQVNTVTNDPIEAVFIQGISQLWFAWPRVSDQQTGLDAGSTVADLSEGRTAIVAMSYGTDRMSWSLYNIPGRAKCFTAGESPNLVYFLVNTNAAAPHNAQIWTARLQTGDFDASYNFVGTTVGIELPFLDMDSPGGMKHFKGMDWVCWPGNANATIKFLYDPNDETKETISQSVATGDSRGRGLIAVEVSAPSIAPVISFTSAVSDASRYRFSGVQLYYKDEAGPR